VGGPKADEDEDEGGRGDYSDFGEYSDDDGP
jgi:hypothetical protein